MKTKYIIGIVAVVIFAALAIYSFDSSKIEYASFPEAKDKAKVVQVIGSWDQTEGQEYNSEANTFSFSMVDELGNKARVVSTGSKPNNFDVAPMVVIKGKFEGNDFHASNILTKCPSKYEGEFEELEGTQLYKN
jgi:cytochrome c-type biogenesis protein CcmE